MKDKTKVAEKNNNEENDLKQLTDLAEIENLILNGENARIPIVVDYPCEDGSVVELACTLKPLTNTEVDNARRMASKIRDTTFQLELLRYGLFTKNGEQFRPEIIYKMYTGVVDALAEKLMEISGVTVDKEEQMELAKNMMGF